MALTDLARDAYVWISSSVVFLVFAMTIMFLVTALLRRPAAAPTDTKNFARIHRAGAFRPNEHPTEIGFWLLNGIFMDLAGAALVTWLAVDLIWFVPASGLSLGLERLSWAGRFVIGLVIIDFSSFSAHWIMHRHLWYYHAVHHAAGEITFMTALRLHPVGKIVFRLVAALALHLLGLDPAMIGAAFFVDALYNFFVHVNINLEFPKPLCYVLGSPNYHRWHHARDERDAFDKNLATMFPVFDLVFGTYYHPPGRLPAAYGVYTKDGSPALPASFVGQLLHPFRWHGGAIRARFARSAPLAAVSDGQGAADRR